MLASTLTTLLSGSVSFKQAKQIHALIITNCITQLEPLLVRRILSSDFSCTRSIARYVQLILYQSQNRDHFSWSCTIRFFSQHGHFKEAFSHYVLMQKLGLCPSSFAVSSTLRACARIADKISGTCVHGQVHKFGFCSCVYVQTGLVDFYSKLGDMDTAQKVFDDMTDKNVVSWNSILSGHVKSGSLAEAQRVFDEIPEKDVISWNTMLCGYTSAGDMEQAYSLFHKMPEKNSASWNSMISGYVDCGDMNSTQRMFNLMPQSNSVSRITVIAGYSKLGDAESARRLFDQMDEKDVLLFNAMIACYAQNSLPGEALKLFNQMLLPDVNVQPDKMTLASGISACSQLGDLKFGLRIESLTKKLGIELDDHLTTALVDLHAKCGSIDKANELFRSLKKKDLVAYSAMILGFGINGKAQQAIGLFEDMVNAKICPNSVTYIGLLAAYGHAGLVEEGYRCFYSMKEHGVVPSADHYAIMVGLVGRAGRLEEAYELIKSMPMKPHAGVWGALLLACRLHKNVELGEVAAENCFELEPDVVGYYSLLSNVYASAERWDDVKRLRKIMKQKKFSKIPGCSWVAAN